MRLIDGLFRRGHLSERALVDALLSGERPAHLDRCDICADRAVDLGRWLDDVKAAGIEAADAAFSTERLAMQQTQILRRLEQLDQPARVIAFPTQARLGQRDPNDRRVAPAWVGVAAAAGLALGLVGGQITARMGSRPAVVQAPVATQASLDDGQAGSTVRLAQPDLDLDLEGLNIPALDAVDGITPKFTTVAFTGVGR